MNNVGVLKGKKIYSRKGKRKVGRTVKQMAWPLHNAYECTAHKSDIPQAFQYQTPFIYKIKNNSRAESEWDGTRWRTGGEVKGKDANGVGSQ